MLIHSHNFFIFDAFGMNRDNGSNNYTLEDKQERAYEICDRSSTEVSVSEVKRDSFPSGGLFAGENTPMVL